jgi:hypothetical protein
MAFVKETVFMGPAERHDGLFFKLKVFESSKSPRAARTVCL